MKKLFLCTALLLAPMFVTFTQAQSKAIDAWQKKYKGTEEAFSLNVNGQLLRFLMWFDGNEEDQDVKELVKGIKHVKMVKVAKNRTNKSQQDFLDLKSAVQRESFDELLTLRSNDSNVDILIKEKNDLVSELLLLVNDHDDFVVLALRGKIDLDKVFKAASKVSVKGM